MADQLSALMSLMGGAQPNADATAGAGLGTSGLESLLGGDRGLSEKDSKTIALLGALRSLSEPQAAGRGPLGALGAIARAAGPVAAVPAEARVLQRRSQLQELEGKIKVMALLSHLKGADPTEQALKRAQTLAALARADKDTRPGSGKTPTTLQAAATDTLVNTPGWKDLSPEDQINAIVGTARRLDKPEKPTSEKNPTRLGVMLGAMRGDPESKAIYDQLKADDLGKQQNAAQIHAQAFMQAMDARKQAQFEDEKRKGLTVPIDPTTFRKLPDASFADVQSGAVKTLPKTDATLATQIESGMRDLYRLKAITRKVLPENRPNTLIGGILASGKSGAGVKAKRAARDADVREFDLLRSITKYPVIQAINKNTTRFPLAEMKDLQEKGSVDDYDTQKSADALIEQALKVFRGTASVIGLDAEALEQGIAADTAAKPSALTPGLPAQTPVMTLPDGSKVYKK